jgi:FG-GAP-like repeat
LNGDGIADLVTSTYNGYVRSFYGNSNGTFSLTSAFYVNDLNSGNRYSWTSTPRVKKLAIGDLNGDGVKDIIVGFNVYQRSVDYIDFYVGDVAVYLSGGQGANVYQINNITSTYYSTKSDTFYPSDLAIADFNGDNKLDIVAINAIPTTPNLGVLLNSGNGVLTKQDNSTLRNLFSGNNSSTAVGDFNGDGKQDLAVFGENGTATSSALSILTSNGNGTFTQSAVLAPIAGSQDTVKVGDFNGDGKLDIVVNTNKNLGV